MFNILTSSCPANAIIVVVVVDDDDDTTPER